MHEHEFQGQKLRHDHAGGNLPHGYFEHLEDGSRATLTSSTPLGDALALVDAAQGNDVESERRLGWLRAQRMSTVEHELVTLRGLAEAIRVHLAKFPESGQFPELQCSGTLWTVTRSMVAEMAGREVTDEEAARIAKAVEFSTAREAVEAAVEQVCGLPG